MNVASKKAFNHLKTRINITKLNYQLISTTSPPSSSPNPINTVSTTINDYLKTTIDLANSTYNRLVSNSDKNSNNTNESNRQDGNATSVKTTKIAQIPQTFVDNSQTKQETIVVKQEKSLTNTPAQTTLTTTTNVELQTKPQSEPELSKISKELVSRRSAIDEQTRYLCKSIRKSSSILVKSNYLEALSKHLYEYTDEARHTAYQENIIQHLKDLKSTNTDKRLIGSVNECLAMLGYLDTPPKHSGINILTLDGGGAKGFVSIEILKNIEKKCGKQIYEIFDYICGTSTGAILACLIGIYKISLDECERYYKLFTKEIFERNAAVGIGNLIMTHAYYDTKCWENMLRDAMGDVLIINSVRDERTPKISIVSNRTTPDQMKVFLFRNYNLPSNQQSHYDGTHKYYVWQAARASSAAPGYYEDFKIEGQIFNDGGVIANNPTAIALHECRQLWPNEKIQCVISVGTGRYQPIGSNAIQASSKTEPSLTIKQKVNRIVGGATSTESVHTILHDLLPPKVYFRFNPYMSEEFHLDENRADKWQVMQYDTQMYVRRNDYKFERATKQLLLPKTPVQRIGNYLKAKLNIN